MVITQYDYVELDREVLNAVNGEEGSVTQLAQHAKGSDMEKGSLKS